MHKIIISLAILASSTLVSFAVSGEPDKELHNKCLYPTIMVMNDNPKGVGTGVIVKSVKKDDHYENYAFTCSHILTPLPKPEPTEVAPPPADVPADAAPALLPEKVVLAVVVKDKYEVTVRIGIYENWSTLVGHKDYRCEVLVVDKAKDIALIKFDTASENSVAVLDKNPKLFIGNDVFKIGCGLNEPFRIDYGKVTSVNKSIGNMIKDTYRVSAMTIMGDSGGPVYHDGKLVGLSQAIRSVPASSPVPVAVPVYQMAYVIPIQRFYDNEEIMRHLKDV